MSAAVRRILIGLLAAWVCHATTASASETGAAAVVHAIPGLVPGEGFGVERGYAPSPLGQVHYQDVRPTQADPRQPVYVLLHQVPWFHVYYNLAQAELARRGIRSIAFDTPGYGLSARPRSPPDIAAYARAIEAAIDHLKLKRIVLVGHHTGATIGVEIARTQPRRLAWLVLHGVALYTPAEAAARLAAPHWDQNYKAEGAHLGDRQPGGGNGCAAAPGRRQTPLPASAGGGHGGTPNRGVERNQGRPAGVHQLSGATQTE
jgi:pimeloyl-ACP methyl ester carboxylesterase